MGMSVYKTEGGGKGKGREGERERKRVGRKGKEGENAEQTLEGTFLFAKQVVLAGKGNGCRESRSLNSLSS